MRLIIDNDTSGSGIIIIMIVIDGIDFNSI